MSLNIFRYVVAVAIGAVPAQGQTMSFFRQFTTPGMDRAIAVAADASGIYVAGNRPAPGGPGSTGVRKFDSRGNELWTREFSAVARGVVSAAADATGVYVVGHRGDNGQLVVVKYSAGGAEVWTRQLEFSAPGGLAVDATGVYVAGRDFPPNSSYLRKYSSDGAELWTSRFGDANNLDHIFGMAADATGVYVVGLAARYGPVTQQFSFVRKYDSRGNELWTRQLDAQLNPGIAAATTANGVFVVTGYVGPDVGGGFTLRKYDAAGNVLWTRQVATSSRLHPSGGALAADTTGVYVVGRTVLTGLWAPLTALPGQCRSGSGGDSFVRKYDLDGAEVWTREFGTSQATSASGVALDASGVYVVGEEGSAQVRDDMELFNVFAPANPASGAFIAKFEKSPAAVGGSGPRIFPDCVVNAASYVGGGVAPGEIVTLFGSGIGPTELATLRLTGDRRLATTLAETRVLFDGVPAPLVHVSEKQSTAIVPYAVSGRTSVEVQAEYKGVRSEALTVPVLASRPGIFSVDGSGLGQAAILNEDGSLNSPSNPAVRGSIVSIFGTGGGEAAPGMLDGQIVSGVLTRTSLPVSVFFARGDYEEWGQGEVLYAGGSSGSVAGLLQVNVRVPPNAAAGDKLPFALVIGSHWELSQVTIALR
jgi:uncharacterized protein (TIGR03437 family)